MQFILLCCEGAYLGYLHSAKIVNELVDFSFYECTLLTLYAKAGRGCLAFLELI
ncbi:MAG: hypothetical protein WKI50_01860 [Aquificaceae bacterium]